ncbi:MAG: AAA family ATPase [Chlamydiales bacterium]|nr:AAA family ATPase [Chlamydiales bacterium]
MINFAANYLPSIALDSFKKISSTITEHPGKTCWLTSVVAMSVLSQYLTFTPSLNDTFKTGSRDISTIFFNTITATFLGDQSYYFGTVANLIQATQCGGSEFGMSWNIALPLSFFAKRAFSQYMNILRNRPHHAITEGNEGQIEEEIKKEPYQKPDFTISGLMEHLDKYIIGQQHAKEALAQAVYLHYNQGEDSQLPKGNILLVGPSGSGKTLLAETLSSYLNIPMAMLDISKVTPDGYIGPKFTDVFHSLLNAAGGNIEKASRGIIFIDEIDKQFKADAKNQSERSFVPPGASLLNQLLCLLQGSDVIIPTFDQRGYSGKINTKDILFIFAGAFHELTSKIPSGSLNDEQLLEHGIRPEFLGRIGYISQLNPLSRDEIKTLLTHGPHSITAGWQQLFNKHGYTLVFKESTLNTLVDEALAKPTGARGMHFALRRMLSPQLTKLIMEKETGNKSRESISSKPKRIEV